MSKRTFVTAKIETEAKFIVPNQDTFAAMKKTTDLGDFRLKSAGVKVITDRYLDVADKRLFRAGYACRIRVAKQKQTLTLKTLTPPDGNVHRRQEFEMEVNTDQPQTWAEGEIKDLVLSIVDKKPLQPLFTIHQTRHKHYVFLQGEPIIELSLDEVSPGNDSKADYFVLEAELLEAGNEADLTRFIDALQNNWALQPESQSKFERAFAYMAGVNRRK